MLTFPYASKVLGVEAMGSVGFADAFCKTFMLISSIGIPIYGVRSIAKNKQDPEILKKTFQEIFIIHLISTIFLGILFFTLVFYLKKTQENLSFYFIGYFIILMNVFSFEWYFMGVEKFRQLSIRYIFVKIFMAILIFIFVKKPSDKIIYFSLTIGMFMGNSILNIFILDKKLFKLTNINKLEFTTHIKPLFYIFLSNSAITIYLFLDTIILGFTCNDTHVGLYSTAIKIAKIPLLLVSTIANVLYPKISSIITSNEKTDAIKLINKVLMIFSTILIPISFGLFSVSDNIILLFSNTQYIDASSTLKILCFIIPIIGFSNVFGILVLSSLSKDIYLTISVAVGMTISIALNSLLSIYLFENGTAIATLLAELSVTIITYYFSKKYCQFKLPSKEIITNTITCSVFIIIANLTSYLSNNYLIHLFITVISCGLYFCLVQIILLKNPIFVELIEIAKNKIKSERI